MAVNYAEKFSQTIDEQLSKDSLTDKAVNKDYDFDGVNKVNVYSVETVPLNDYDINAKATDTEPRWSLGMMCRHWN